MEPVTLQSGRLLLSPPTMDDVDAIVAYCQDPLFEQYLTTPWPYARDDALIFIDLVAGWWRAESEFTFGIRHPAGDLLGMIGWRTRGDVGFWIGAEHRGQGYMVEALATVVDWVFRELGAEQIDWECVPGNVASARTARAAGFRYTGLAPAIVARRDGSFLDAWHGVLRRDDNRTPQPGWPV